MLFTPFQIIRSTSILFLGYHILPLISLQKISRALRKSAEALRYKEVRKEDFFI